ncbi:tRNA (adenosine(37)-N6)-threonylcarbamoyltransferase complex dimerization subunit type 1 TsaB [Aminivibrio sp.]|jgi:tRNA threonylcarbamoyladenosine biosynthesis protein TsaB|uniref:tRNA (adenosine(37)-N6)-threonylcarbamoyltransferase complex dimerization subunit type 1 TsaB n=1 Tax=Aminivibrio sp. TaxID=1872489 RepID=UPI001A56B199|nr:tRNA (adenosine(37)-N6)-threonylcarbamoyltransferase complex dimerization subunit type 1 TsaB [Aminivibrio sp.]MBL3538881.1 tRNA (adenosine(37)-N6)-threonylcarbamoyltransferase complex dimerization subunit type 1 TsaB [Aminivibrio sp.]
MKYRILSINCSNARWTALGLSEGGIVRGEINLDLGKRQSSVLPSLVDFFLGSFLLKVTDLDFVAVVNGPGSFTGIKVGVAFSQFLAWACGGKPVIPLSSLETLSYARPGRSHQYVCPLLWAGGGRVYSALFGPAAAGECPKEAMPTRAYSRGELQAALAHSGARERDILFISDAPEKCAGLFAETIIGPFEPAAPRGSADVLLAEHYTHRAIPPQAVRARYLRDPDIG